MGPVFLLVLAVLLIPLVIACAVLGFALFGLVKQLMAKAVREDPKNWGEETFR
jgi:hypothetical protein